MSDESTPTLADGKRARDWDSGRDDAPVAFLGTRAGSQRPHQLGSRHPLARQPLLERDLAEQVGRRAVEVPEDVGGRLEVSPGVVEGSGHPGVTSEIVSGCTGSVNVNLIPGQRAAIMQCRTQPYSPGN
jgi:hypothetical protein